MTYKIYKQQSKNRLELKKNIYDPISYQVYNAIFLNGVNTDVKITQECLLDVLLNNAMSIEITKVIIDELNWYCKNNNLYSITMEETLYIIKFLIGK